MSSDLRTGFVPSEHGFAFPNRWEDRITRITVAGRPFEIALSGRCGGMVFAALDYHHMGIRARELAGRELPPRDSTLARYIMRRQLESLGGALGANIRRFVVWTLSPTGSRWGTVAYSRRSEAGKVLVAMVARNPVPLGLLTVDRLGGVGLNHQVLAYAADSDDERLQVHVYDPNHPLRDDVTVVVPWSGDEPFVQYAGGTPRKRWRGLFVERYTRRVPPGVT